MLKFANLDDKVSVTDQFGEDAAPVVLVNVFTVDRAEADRLEAAWTEDAKFMRRQPGFISTQLHRGVGESSTYLNYAVWESVAAFKAAFEQPDFRAHLSSYPDSTITRPHLFRKVEVPGVCGAE